MKKTIAIDIDDVLADNAAGFVAFSNERWGMSLNPSDYTEHWAEVWRVGLKEAEGRSKDYYDSGVYRAYRHDEYALPVLTRLADEYTLVIVTSRRQDMRDGTVEWIHNHYPGIFTDDRLFFAGMWDDMSVDIATRLNTTKGDLYRQLNVDYVIDDQLKHCVAADDLGLKALLFGDYSWNQSDDLSGSINRVNGWNGVEKYFYGN